MPKTNTRGLELLAPDFPPIRLPNLRNWAQAFEENFRESNEVTVVTGFASESSLLKLLEILRFRESNHTPLRAFTLVIGYAFFDGLTQRQINAVRELEAFLALEGLGHVRIPLGIKVHSKVAIFRGPGGHQALMGSSNFTELLVNRKSELDLIVGSEEQVFPELVEYVGMVVAASSPVDNYILEKIPILSSANPTLISSPLVQKSEVPDIQISEGVSFRLPLKPKPKSNLNKFNAAPRGRTPRSWWEVEIIVPTSIQVSPEFPNQTDGSNRFTVFTRDGISFACHVSGGSKPRSNKNLESSDDLRILGYWIKGKMIEQGCLDEGDPVTAETIEAFGHSALRMTKLEGQHKWLLEFAEG